MISLLIKPAYAQGITNPALPFAGKGSGILVFGNLVSAAVGMFLIFGFIMAFLHLVLGAIAWITASGDKSKLQAAQDRITQAVVGLIIMVAIWAIMTLLGKFVGFDFPNFPLPTIDKPGGNTLPTQNQLPYIPFQNITPRQYIPE